MALPGVSLVRLRGLCCFGKCSNATLRTSLDSRGTMRWFRSKSGRFGDSESLRDRRASSLLEEFPQPKNLLNNSIARCLGLNDLSQVIRYSCTEEAGLKRATVTVLWPRKIQEEGCATKRFDAERFAAAAACLKLKELGLIGPDNQLPRRRSSREREKLLSSWSHHLQQDWTESFQAPSDEVNGEKKLAISEALALFPHPKELLFRVVQVATATGSVKDVINVRWSGGRLKTCQLMLLWPEKMTFTASSNNKAVAEKRAAALACMKLKELNLLDKNNNPLTHAKYHSEQVQAASERERRPLTVEVPEYLQDQMREYLAQYPIEDEETRWQVSRPHGQEADEACVTDGITGRPYRPLSEEEVHHLNMELQKEWEKVNPDLSPPLPVDAHRQQVLSAVQSSRVVVIAGETGCGKTTRIPRFFLEESGRGGRGAQCNVLVTQPRRISAVSVAHRVAHELGPALKHSVGYQVRLESRPPERSAGALLFLTVGVLLRKLQSNPTLRGISHVFVDEVHERDINTDLLLALLRSTLQQNPHLRVVLMSATGDNQRLAQYFGGCPVVKVPGFMHPVQDLYLEDILREMGSGLSRREEEEEEEEEEAAGKKGEADDLSPDVALVADVIEHIDRSGRPGAILCFLPGWQDIKAVQETLEEKPHFSHGSQMILPLHSSLSVTDQQAVFQRLPEHRRKIVLATNIAETSITIDDVVHVVDTGTHKELSYDPRTKVSCLDTVWVSQSNVRQRKGRAGRCQPGRSYHLFPRRQLHDMTPFPVPEILRTPLESLVVQAKIHSPHCKAVEFLSQVLDSPSQGAVTEAVRNLQDIGVLDRAENLTPLGARVAVLSCDPRLGKVLVLSAVFRCVLPMLSVAACLSRDPFHNSLQNRALVNKAKQSLSDSSHSDYLVFSRVVLGWRQVQYEGGREDRDDYLAKYCLSRSSLRFINGLISQFSDNLREAQMVPAASECQRRSGHYNQHSQQDQLLSAVLLAGLYPNLIKVKRGIVTKGGRFRPNGMSLSTQRGSVQLHRSSVNRGKEDLPSRWLTFFSAVKSSEVVFVRDSCAVHPLALLLLTDCDIMESVRAGGVQVSLRGSSLVCCQLPLQTWELLWDLRNAIQAMLRRALTSPAEAFTNSLQDGQLISLLVRLLNETSASPVVRAADGEVD
ncbi:ATP-dependent RNA helicase DHX30 [Synchiropus splendidus]|uniref:ATP-dependent RNA helicase DHX30 n=1 Tax=Synchiropus splendidus TaxID=270530 RepID=UPI00237D6DB9|nr:ATP-dependent RNA helicase DHX30 [Synchiropus splendidus]